MEPASAAPLNVGRESFCTGMLGRRESSAGAFADLGVFGFGDAAEGFSDTALTTTGSAETVTMDPSLDGADIPADDELTG